ncbi:MAG: glycosyltransferase [Opitutae bacterium]|nr:glycosyltransferase [Opitutae bacterium]
MKRVLIVSPHFPPVNAPDMQRVRVALPYFVEAGWEVTVLTVADPTPTAPVEPELAATVPGAVRVVRARCLSRRWTGWLGVNNVALRSLPFLFLAGRRLLRGRRHDVVYFSTTMFVVLPLGRLWKLLCGAPYVIDLQDPWISDYYDRPGAPRPPGGWKYQFAQGLGRALEGWTMRGAAHIIAVSERYLDTLRTRYPGLRATPATELPFGSPDPDLARLRATWKSRAPLLPASGLRLAFAGALGPGQLAAVEILFAALAEVRRTGLHVSAHFFGTSYAPQGKPATLALAAKHGLAGCVHETPARLRYFEALQVTLEADANLVFGSTDLPFTPSKILAVLAAGRPVIALAPAGSAMVARLAALGETCMTFPVAGPNTAAISETAARLRQLAAGRLAPVASSEWERYSARAVAEKQMSILTAAATG